MPQSHDGASFGRQVGQSCLQRRRGPANRDRGKAGKTAQAGLLPPCVLPIRRRRSLLCCVSQIGFKKAAPPYAPAFLPKTRLDLSSTSPRDLPLHILTTTLRIRELHPQLVKLPPDPRLDPRRPPWPARLTPPSNSRARFSTRRRQAIKRPPTLQIAPAPSQKLLRQPLNSPNGASFTSSAPHCIVHLTCVPVQDVESFASFSPEAAPSPPLNGPQHP
ncbi:Nn.00g038280.m01.CDS01 [Neocucurbitaria sp. VM-36]